VRGGGWRRVCGAYLQETVISIFVAGTVELSGSKSPIVAMAEGLLFCAFFQITSSKPRKFSQREFVPVAVTCLFHPAERRTRRRRARRPAPGSGVVVASADGRWSAVEG